MAPFSAAADDATKAQATVLVAQLQGQAAQFGAEANRLLSAIDAKSHEVRQFADVARDAHAAALQEAAAKAAAEVKATTDVLVQRTADQLRHVTEMSAKAIVSDRGRFFFDEARRFRRASIWWLAWVLLLVAVMLVGAVTALVRPDLLGLTDDVAASGELVALHISARVVVVAVFAALLFFAIRNYQASRHNEVVSRHRHGSMDVFLPLLEQFDDPATRNALLVKVAEAVFLRHETGFATQGNEPAAMMIQSLPSLPGVQK